MSKGNSRDSSCIMEESLQNQDDHIFNQEYLLNSRCGHSIRECDLVDNLYEMYEENHLMEVNVNEELYPLKRFGSH
jgi:hypothetical protein